MNHLPLTTPQIEAYPVRNLPLIRFPISLEDIFLENSAEFPFYPLDPDPAPTSFYLVPGKIPRKELIKRRG